jgi:hypothetical protein
MLIIGKGYIEKYSRNWILSGSQTSVYIPMLTAEKSHEMCRFTVFKLVSQIQLPPADF